MKILLTGAKGNLGQALQRAGQAHRFITLDRGDWGQVVQKLEGVDVVIHAASDLKTPFANAPEQVTDSNLGTTIHLLEAMRKSPGAKLLFVSSCAVYGRSEITSELVPPAPISLNGVSKLLNEKMIAEFSRATDLPYAIVRVFNSFGGTDQFSILWQLRQALHKKQPFNLFNQGISQRDYVHVDDVAQVIFRLLKLKWPNPIVNIGTGETTKTRDIVNCFCQKFGEVELIARTRIETEYSRADITQLRELIPDFTFRPVLDFLKSDFRIL